MPRRDFTKVPFAATGDATSIPTAVQPDGSVSMTTGYGFDYQRDNGAGGGAPDPLAKSIPRDATNGILNEITTSIGEIQLNGLAIWAASAAPYPINATVRHNNTNWLSTVANNSAQPGVAPLANWIDTTVQIPQATESDSGIARIATAQQALEGTDNATIMTPAKTKAVIVQAAPGAATEKVAGIAKIATQALTGAGVDDTTIVTPKKLRWGFNISLAENGYICLPSWLGGVILQWGRVTAPPSNANATSATIAFPMAFPGSCYLVVAAPQGSGNTINGGIPSHGFSGVPSKNGTTVNLDMLNFTTINQAIPVAWWALGV